MQQLEWRLVPTEPTQEMLDAQLGLRHWDQKPSYESRRDLRPHIYRAMLAAAPEPPHLSMTKQEAAAFQDWKGMDGACAFHLIERHANGWGETARMMEAWLAANVAPSNAEVRGA